MKRKITMFLLALLFVGSGQAQQKNWVSHKLVSSHNIHNGVSVLSESQNSSGREVNDEWLHWDDGENAWGIGNGNSEFTVAAKWDGNQLISYNGSKVTKVRFFIMQDGFSAIILKIWTGTNASNLVYQKQLSSVLYGNWNQVDITSDITIDSGQEFWVGYTVVQPVAGKFPAGADSGPANAGYGDMISVDGVWFSLSEEVPDLNYNWNLQFFVEEETSQVTSDFSGSPTNIGVGQSVVFNNLSTGATSWVWVFEGGTPSTSTLKNPTVVYNTQGSFNVTLTAKNGAVEDVKQKVNYITVSSNPVVADFSASSTDLVPGQLITFDNLSSGATSWAWVFEGGTPSTSTQENPIVTYNNEGNFNVTLTAKNGSVQDVMQKVDYIKVNSEGEVLAVEITADPGTTICEFGSIILTASPSGGTGNYQYTWTWDIDSQISSGSVFSKSSLIESTNVYLTVSSGGQTVNKTTAITVTDKPPASIMGKGNPERMLICPYPELQYQWYQNNTLIPGATMQFYYPGEGVSLSGTYYLKTNNDQGCYSFSENYTIDDTKSGDGFAKSDFMSAYPNPTNGKFSIDIDPALLMDMINKYTIEIYSSTGGKVWKTTFSPGFRIYIKPDINLSSGLYILKLYGDNKLFETQKLLVD